MKKSPYRLSVYFFLLQKNICVAICLLIACFISLFAAHPVFAGGIPDGPNVQITDAGLGDDRAGLPDLAVRGESVYAVWEDNRPNVYGADSIFFAKSTDGGKTWGENIRVNELPYDDWAQEPQIAVNAQGAIFVLWHTFYKNDSDQINDLRLGISADDGESFTVMTLIDGYDRSADLRYPKLASDSGNGRTYFLTTDYRNLDDDEGYYIDLMGFNADGSFAFESKVLNDVDRSGRGTFSSIGSRDEIPQMDIAVYNGTVCAAWEDRRERSSIFGTCSVNGGETFGANFNISGADGIMPQLGLAPDGSLYAIYANSSDTDRNIRLRRSPDLGDTWSDELIVTGGLEPSDIQNWELEIDDNNQVIVAWADEYGANGDIILSTSLDQGVTFGHQRVDDDSEQNADTFEVSLTVGGSGEETRAYIAWRDDRIDYDDKIWSQPIILDGTGPTSPSGVRASGGDNSILLTWVASTDTAGIADYRIYRAGAASGPFVEISPRGAYSTFYRDVEVTDGETYFYQIAGVDGTGNTGVRSDPIRATTNLGSGIRAGGTIAYVDGENVKLLDLPSLGNQRTLTQGNRPYFSENGERLYYAANDSVSSKLIAGGGEQTHYVNEDFSSNYDITPDGTKIGALLADNFITGSGTFCYVYEPTFLDQSLPRFSDENNLSFSVALSYTGKWLAYDYTGFCNVAAFGLSNPPDFCIVNTQTSEKNCINGADIDAPDFSARGAQIVFSASSTGQKEIWTAEVQDNGSLAKYVQITRGPTNQPSTEPAFSSNGEWIIFQRDMDTSEDERFELYVVKFDGSGLRPLNLSGKNAAWHNGPPSAAPNPVGLEQTEKLLLPLVSQ